MTISPLEPKVLVIIPCLNEELHLAKLLDSLLLANQSSDFTYTIVDGGSTDKTLEIAQGYTSKNPNILFLENPKRIQSAGINLAVETYGKDVDYLIRIDAHSGYPNDYCTTLLSEALSTKADSVVVSMITTGNTPFGRAVAAAQNSRLGNGGSCHRLTNNQGKWIDHGHHALMRVSGFRSVGGYDETFSHNEDAELDYRLIQKGFKIWLTGKTTITYHPRSTPLALFLQYRGYGYGRANTLLKHKNLPKIRQLMPIFILPFALLTLLGTFSNLLALPFLAWFLLCIGYGIWLALLNNDITIVMSGFAALIMHFSWSLGFWQAILTKWMRKR